MKKQFEIIELQWLAALTTVGKSPLLKKHQTKNLILSPTVEKKQKKSKLKKNTLRLLKGLSYHH